MSPSGGQLSRNFRIKKIRRSRVAPFEGGPQRKGMVYKIEIMTTRKPN